VFVDDQLGEPDFWNHPHLPAEAKERFSGLARTATAPTSRSTPGGDDRVRRVHRVRR